MIFTVTKPFGSLLGVNRVSAVELLLISQQTPNTFASAAVTLMVLFAGAVWFVPSATFTVMVDEPPPTAVTVTVVPDTDTVATLVLLDVAVIAPSPARVTVIVPVLVEAFRLRLVLLRDSEPAALLIFHVAFFAVTDPSDH